jgi:hypothetical protein
LGEEGQAGSLTCQGPFAELPVVIDQPGKQPQLHNRAIACGREVGDLADGGGVLVSGNGEGAGLDLARVAGLVQEGPEVADLIFVVEVSGDIDAVPHGPPLAGSCS